MRAAAMLAAGVLVASGLGAPAQQGDPIGQRQALMKNNQEQVRTLVGMSRGQVPFDPNRARAAFEAIGQNAERIPTLFPPDSQSGKTNALPAIWERKADFDAHAAKLGQDARAVQAGLTDTGSLQAALQRVGQDCGGCHESFRRKQVQ